MRQRTRKQTKRAIEVYWRTGTTTAFQQKVRPTMSRKHPIKPIPEDQLEKLSTPRLLAVRRRLTASLKFLGCHAGDGAEWATERLNELQPFDDSLRRVMAKREHVERT